MKELVTVNPAITYNYNAPIRKSGKEEEKTHAHKIKK